METETPNGNSVNEIKINLNHDNYKIILYIDLSKLIIKLELDSHNPNKIYQNGFILSEIRDFHMFFQGFKNLQEANETISQILKNPSYQKKIEQNENENNISLIINFLDEEISIPLQKVVKQSELNYNTLSQEMKYIIDNNEIILGIDLGTTYSCASIMLDDQIIMIENSLGLRTTPSYVCFFEPDKICIGELAKLQPSYEFRNIIYDVKRLLGRNINDREIKEIIPDLPFTINKDNDLDQLKISINFGKKKKDFYPEQISALILKKLIEDSEFYLSKKLKKKIKIKNAVITVPAYFNQKQREATYQAAEMINLNIKRMINEPTAASLAYGYQSLENNQKLITVLDFGGGTLDLTLLQFTKNEIGIYCDIKFSFGDTHFGGEDFDYILMKKCLESVGEKNFDKKLQCNVRLKRACEIAKIKLSTCENTNIILEEYSKDINIDLPLSRYTFEKYCSSLFDKFENILKTFLKDCGCKCEDISEVILIGGSTLIPKIEDIIHNVFKFSEIKKNLNPKESVAKGAAIQAAIISKLSPVKNLNLLDVTNLSFGIKIIGDKMSKIIKRSKPLPEEASHIYFTTSDNQTEALIEIFEGEDNLIKNNLNLGKFLISGLPKMKKGEAKIKVNIFINKDSLLEVTAYDMQNKNNSKKLEIKRPKGLRDKIDELKIKTKKINIIDLEEYTSVKDSIIDLEEEILKTEEKETKQKKYSEIINIFAEIVMTIMKKIDKEKIAISYIKYYFLKVAKYLQNYNENKIIDNFSKNFNLILDEIQFNTSDLIFEVIESFVDNINLYSKCIVQLLDHYYAKFVSEFYKVNDLLIKQPKNYTKAFKYLEELREKINFAINFCQIKAEKETKWNLISIQNSIKELYIKIEVKKLILRNKMERINFNIKEEKENFEKLLEKYQQCQTNDLKDLLELESMIKRNNQVINENEKKYRIFINKFEDLKDDNLGKFSIIFETFGLNKYSITDLEENIMDNKKRNPLLIELIGIYQKKEKDLTEGVEKEAINKILVYLNHLKEKCKEDKPLFNY